MKPTKNKTWLLPAAVTALALAACVAPRPETVTVVDTVEVVETVKVETVVVDTAAVEKIDPFDVKEDTKLTGGEHTFSSVNIPSGVTVTVTDDVVINVTGDTDIAGTLGGECVGVALQGQGDVTITGIVDNQCGEEAEDAKGLLIQTDGGVLTIGTEDSPATLSTSGLLDITNDPSLEEWEFDVLPDQRSESSLPPVCSAQAATIVGTATPDVPEEVTFYGAGVDPDGGPVTYTWDFGDGGSAAEAEPFHDYHAPGVYDVVLTVTDDDEETCQATLRVVLDDGEEIAPDAPGLWVDPLVLVVETGQEVNFNSDALDSLGQELTYHWDFGDGETSTEIEPLHTYTEAGRYPVTVSVTGPDGATSTASASIYVYPTPAAGEARSPGLAYPASMPLSQKRETGMVRILAVHRGGRITGRYSGDVTFLPFNDIQLAGGKPGRKDGGAAGSIDIRATGDVTFQTPYSIEAGNGADGKFPGGDDDVRGGRGGRGGSVIVRAGDDLTIQSGAIITAGNGGDGGGNGGAGGPLPAHVVGGNGGEGGRVIIKAGGTLTIERGVEITSGKGGKGGDAEAKSSFVASARGGNGGRAGRLVVEGRKGIVLNNVGIMRPVAVTGGDGGKGGLAEATGEQGANKCPRGGAGANARARGGNGGGGLGGFIGRNIVYNIPRNNLMIIGGNGGEGGEAKAEGGPGGDAICPGKKEAYGGKGGPAEASGGKGGSAKLAGNVAAWTIGGPGAPAFTGGKGGDATARSGRGGHATATGNACGDSAHAVGGDAGYAEALGGRGGGGYKVSGAGGDAWAYPGHGGDATAIGGNCGAGDCGKNGGNAKAIAGDSDNGLARGGRGARGAGSGAASTGLNLGQGWGLGLGGTAEAKGGNGGGCKAADCPAGKGGNGGAATAQGGMGGLLRDDEGERRADGGNAEATGGNGGTGASCCKGLEPGGDGGAGGDADASIKQGGVTLKEKGGDGGQGGDGKDPANGGKGGSPDGDMGPDGNPCPAATQPATLTQEDVVKQINAVIAEKGYDWEAGITTIAGLTPEEMQMLPQTPDLVEKLFEEINELVDQASSSRRVTSSEEMKQRLDEGGLLVGEMVVYEDFLYYKGGVYRHAWGDRIGSHAVEIEGYDDAQGCWRAKNSWGTSWGEDRGFFRMAYGETGIEDNVYEITYVTTPTPAPPPTVTPTPAPTGKEYVDECIAYLEQGRALLAEHETGGCTEGLRLLRLAIDRSTIALNLNPDDANAYFCRAMSRRWLEEGLNEAIEDMQSALDLGLAGDRKAEAEQELVRLRQKAASPICVSMGIPVFAEGWDWDAGVPVNPGTEFPANSTREVWARWTLSNPCNEVAVVKWYHDGVHKCQHDTDVLTGEYDGSGWIADEEWIETGEWCVAVYINDVEKTKGCFTVTEQPTPPPSSDAPVGAPEILSIEFPSTIPADGTPVDGTLHFKDLEADINWASFDVISGDFSGFGFNPTDFIVEGGVEQGVSLFNMHCNVVQEDVTMRVMLFDGAGNSSPPVSFSFSCR